MTSLFICGGFMYIVSTGTDDVYLKNINPADFNIILEWYNKEEFKYATGIDGTLTLHQLAAMYKKIQQTTDHFFAGIFTAAGKIIGILKGQIRYGRDCYLWINTLIVEPDFQNKGYGTKVVKLFINYAKLKSNISKVYLSVAEHNVGGYRFWSRLGFVHYGRIDECTRLKGEVQNAIIMHKIL